MARFRDFIRRVKKQPAEKTESVTCTNKTSKQYVELVSSSESCSEIASIPAAGMQRSNQLTYITTHSSISTSTQQDSQRRQSSDISTNSDSSKTCVEDCPVLGKGQSVWKGAANGRQYDKREELTPEDEDMWAKMAM